MKNFLHFRRNHLELEKIKRKIHTHLHINKQSNQRRTFDIFLENIFFQLLASIFFCLQKNYLKNDRKGKISFFSSVKIHILHFVNFFDSTPKQKQKQITK